MKLELVRVPIDGGRELEAIDSSLASHRVMNVEQEFVAEGYVFVEAVFDNRSGSEGLDDWGVGLLGSSLGGGTGWAFVDVGKGGSKLPRSMGRPCFERFLGVRKLASAIARP